MLKQTKYIWWRYRERQNLALAFKILCKNTGSLFQLLNRLNIKTIKARLSFMFLPEDKLKILFRLFSAPVIFVCQSLKNKVIFKQYCEAGTAKDRIIIIARAS
jgi:hypothetical protein